MQWNVIDGPTSLPIIDGDSQRCSVFMEYLTLDRLSSNQQIDKIGLRHFIPSSAYWNKELTSYPVCIYLPGRFANANIVFEDYRYDLRQYLAKYNIHVYCMDYRTHFLNYAIEQEKQRCGSWNTATFLEDIAEIVHFVRARHNSQQVVLIGHSMGCTLAYLYAATSGEQDLAGLIALDGGVKSPNSSTICNEFNFSEELDLCRRENRMVFEQFGSFQRFRNYLLQAMDTQQANCRQTRMLRTLIEQLLDGKGKPVMGWPRGRMSNLSDGIGNLDMLLPYLASHDGYWPMVQVLEALAISCGCKDPQLPPYDQGLENISIPLLNVVALGRNKSHSSRNLYSSRMCTHAPQTEILLEHFGHLDVVVCPQVEQKVMEPILHWLLQKN